MLLRTVEVKKLAPAQLITHRFRLDEILQAYETFEHAADQKALKVILSGQDG